MNKYIIFILLTALTFVVGSCTTDGSDEPTPEQPKTPEYLMPGSDARPDWKFSDNGRYELRMSIQVELGDTLAAYQSSQDLICATIGGEVRAVAQPNETGGIVYYPLIIFDNETGRTVSLSYYCDQLHRIYTITSWAVFDASAAPTGNSGIYRPKFTVGN